MKTIIAIALICCSVYNSSAQETIHQVGHNEISFAATYSSLDFVDKASFVQSVVTLGGQFRYARYFPLAKFYGIGTGASLGIQDYGFIIDIEKLGYPSYYHPGGLVIIENADTFSVFTFGIPVYLSGAYPLSPSCLINVKMGINITTVFSSSSTNDEVIVVDPDSTDQVVLTVDYKVNSIPQAGFLFEIGPQYTLRSGGIISLSLVSTLNFFSRTKVDYTLYPEMPNDSESGAVVATGSYVGLSFGFVFTGN
ncbi:hypothetical protein [Reichenbachiella sp. MSK19-1]|uniref:hypothetical protein n=1 Tax=Reichenbachiella sp. MSK19-1 TaxID=1897631 RepID=UPI000E6CA4BD|nr:hypothetical protein [Reichenbachiella sp. MSK19-1]RJE74689.1 hypothetical protein BGP76_16270 [Reichenbachiella sp. MSK19-1]